MYITKTIFKLLTFRLTQAEMLQLSNKHFVIGVVGTWIVGMGRYWDDRKASLIQHLGLGSVIYIFLLALFIWLIVKPFLVTNWTYFRVLTFISLTSFPAIFYAIPVEKFFTLYVANRINVWFLAIVATWRLALLYYFLKKITEIAGGYIVALTLLPICLIVTTLTILNLHRVVFEIMGGITNQTSNDGTYGVLIVLTYLSAILVIPLLVIYGVGIYETHKSKNNAMQDMQRNEYHNKKQ